MTEIKINELTIIGEDCEECCVCGKYIDEWSEDDNGNIFCDDC